MPTRDGYLTEPDGGRPIRVLEIDDDSDFAEVVATALERESDRLTVEMASSVESGLDALDARNFDCIVCDYDMPEMDGLAFFERVQSHHEDIPFILFTGKGSEDVASRAISKGVTDYLTKGGGTDRIRILANRIRNAVDAHRSREQARQNRRRLETLISNLPGMVYHCVNEPDWPMEFVAGECESLCGYTADELTDDPTLWGEEIIFPDDSERLWETVQDALADREPFEVTYRILTRDGEQRWMWERGRGIYDDGETVALEGFITDVTDRRERAEVIESLHGSTRDLLNCESREAVAEATTGALVELIDMPKAGIFLHDEGEDLLRPTAWTDAAEADIGRLPTLGEETLTWSAFQAGETRIYDELGAVKDAAERKTPYESLLTVPIGDHGAALVVSLETGAFDEEDGRLVELLCANAAAVLDRLGREQALRERERALERENERLDRFVSLASHDLRNPLDAAQMRLELAQRDCDSEHLAVVERSHDRMEELLSDLLSLARTGESVTDRSEIHLGNLVRRCRSLVDTGAATIDVDADATVMGDESRLAELFENLLRNAVEHGSTDPDSQARQDAVEHNCTGSGAGADDADDSPVTVTVGTLDDGFYVADDGPGIPPEDRDEVFEAGYSTADHSTGFGLSIVREIVRAHGWQVEITASETGGARFEIRGVDLSR